MDIGEDVKVSYDCDVPGCEERDRETRVANIFCWRWWKARGAERYPARALSPRAPPQPGRARRLSLLASGLRAAVWPLQIDETREHMSFPASEAGVLDLMGGVERKLLVLPPGDEHGAILREATHKVDHPLLGSLLNVNNT